MSDSQNPQKVIVRHLGLIDYVPVWEAMKAFTDARSKDTLDEIWLLQHPPVFTQGQAGKAEHLLAPGDIPVVQVDRGGQVTYHGPGQLIAYILVDLERFTIGPRALVTKIEQAIVKVLADLDITALPRTDAPGVYVEDSKIASLGLRIRKKRSYHGLSLNIDMDLTPFQRINPCGYAGMAVTQVKSLIDAAAPDLYDTIAANLLHKLVEEFGYSSIDEQRGLPPHE